MAAHQTGRVPPETLKRLMPEAPVRSAAHDQQHLPVPCTSTPLGSISTERQSKNSSQLSAFPKPKIFTEPTHYFLARSFVREFADWSQIMFPADPAMQSKVFASYLGGMPKHWYDTVVRGSSFQFHPETIYRLFEERFGPKSVELNTGDSETENTTQRRRLCQTTSMTCAFF